MSLEKLPFEIVDNIFQYIERKHYYPHLYVSKKWHTLVKPIYYQEITIANSNFGWFLQQLLLKEKSIVKFQLFSMTRKLCIRDKRDRAYTIGYRFRSEEVMALFSHFKNIKVLNIAECDYKTSLVEILNEKCQVEHFPQLEEIVIDDYETKVCLPLYLKFCKTIKRVHFSYNSSKDGMEFLMVLSTLQSLDSLVVVKRSSQPDITLFGLLMVCPSLSFIDFIFMHLPQDPNDEELGLQKLLKSMKSNQLSFKHLKAISLTLHSLSMPYMDFIMKHCPETVDRLEIKLSKQGLFEWIRDMSMETVLQFATCLSEIKTFTLSTNEEDMELLWDQDAVSKMDKFYEILNTIRGNRKLTSCTANFSNRDPSIRVSMSKNSILSYHYHIVVKDFLHFVENENENPNGNRSRVQFAIPFPTISCSTGIQAINNLVFDIEQYALPFLNDFFEYATQYCPNLSSFELSLFDDGAPNGKISARQQDSNIKSSLKDMTYVTVRGITEESPYWPKTLLQYFPKMTVLNYDTNPFDYIDNNIIELEYRQFRHLETIKIEIDCIIEIYDINYLYFEFYVACMGIGEEYEFCYKLDKDNHILQSVPVDVHYTNHSRPLKPSFDITINCLQAVKKIELSDYKLFDMDLLFPGDALDPGKTLYAMIILF